MNLVSPSAFVRSISKTQNVAGLAVVSGRSDGEQLIYAVLEPEQALWGDSESLGKVLTRKQLLEEGLIVGWEVHAEDDSGHAAHLVPRTAFAEGLRLVPPNRFCMATMAVR